MAKQLNKISIAEYRTEQKKVSAGCKTKDQFLSQLHLAGLPEPAREITFALPRKWRFDFAYPERKIAIEYQGIFGGKTVGASHGSRQNLRRDYEKFTEGALRGWLIILISAETVRTGQALQWVRRAFEARAGQEAA